jgi:DNA-directed RNA polymerase specialized sigma subunit
MSTFNPTETRSKDLELWEAWKKTGSKKDLSNLLDQLSGVIYSEVHRASGSLPTTALTMEAKNWAYKAIQTYDPSKGTSLSTHVMNYLPKVRRMNYKYQNAVRLPENLQLKYHEYNRHLTQLTDELNRDPTDEELAKRIGWSKPQVVKFKNSLYSDLIESASERPAEFTQFNQGSILMAHIMDSLSPEEKFIFDNAKTMSSTEVAAKLGVNLNRYNYLKKKLIDKVAVMKQEVGL